VQPFEPLAHVGDPGGQIDPCGWTKAKHGLGPFQQTHNAFKRGRVKITLHLDSTTARQHHGQPATRFVLRRRFPGCQLHGHQTTARGDWLTPFLPTQFLSMAIQCAEAQTSTLAKLAPPHTATHKLGHQLLNFLRVYVAWVLTTLFFRSSGHFNTVPANRTGVLVSALSDSA
jgi:hypothetical protein